MTFRSPSQIVLQLQRWDHYARLEIELTDQSKHSDRVKSSSGIPGLLSSVHLYLELVAGTVELSCGTRVSSGAMQDCTVVLLSGCQKYCLRKPEWNLAQRVPELSDVRLRTAGEDQGALLPEEEARSSQKRFKTARSR